MSLTVSTTTTLSNISPIEWNKIADSNNPFLNYEFLYNLEKAGCVNANTTWKTNFFLIHNEKNILIAALPFYIRYDSRGEFVFDYSWADAYNRIGLSYYPKGVCSIPFTPVNGLRILYNRNLNYKLEDILDLLIPELIKQSEKLKLSSIHFLFLTKEESVLLEKYSFITRKNIQFHWVNNNYKNFDDYLKSLNSSKRKNIKKERLKITNLNINIKIFQDNEITLEMLQIMYKLYISTYETKWGDPYLNLTFFVLLFNNFRKYIVLVLAFENETNKIIAGTINFIKGSKLFGRYWGTFINYSNLHFELCYYQLIEFAIKNNIEIFEAGAQGEQKFMRGFDANYCYSSHFIFNNQARIAIRKFIAEENEYIYKCFQAYNSQSPVKSTRENFT